LSGDLVNRIGRRTAYAMLAILTLAVGWHLLQVEWLVPSVLLPIFLVLLFVAAMLYNTSPA
jgi:Na+/glutamate symporter